MSVQQTKSLTNIQYCFSTYLQPIEISVLDVRKEIVQESVREKSESKNEHRFTHENHIGHVGVREMDVHLSFTLMNKNIDFVRALKFIHQP